MTFDVTIVIPTFGGRSWSDLAERRALPSAQAQNVPTVHVHYPGATLAEARNRILDEVTTEFAVYLDADDELEADYTAHLAKGMADLRVPAVRYVKQDWLPVAPRMPRVAGHQHDCTGDCLPYGNWLVVGTAAPVQLIRDAGGWREYAWSEDWDLWVRCWKLGATVEAIPAAVYRAHVRADSRNRSPDLDARMDVHRAIARDLGLPVP